MFRSHTPGTDDLEQEPGEIVGSDTFDGEVHDPAPVIPRLDGVLECSHLTASDTIEHHTVMLPPFDESMRAYLIGHSISDLSVALSTLVRPTGGSGWSRRLLECEVGYHSHQTRTERTRFATAIPSFLTAMMCFRRLGQTFPRDIRRMIWMELLLELIDVWPLGVRLLFHESGSGQRYICSVVEPVHEPSEPEETTSLDTSPRRPSTPEASLDTSPRRPSTPETSLDTSSLRGVTCIAPYTETPILRRYFPVPSEISYSSDSDFVRFRRSGATGVATIRIRLAFPESQYPPPLEEGFIQIRIVVRFCL